MVESENGLGRLYSRNNTGAKVDQRLQSVDGREANVLNEGLADDSKVLQHLPNALQAIP